MDAITDYLQPLAIWIYNHPLLALVATFLISLSESLAFIGSLVPGTVSMTAIGILAGSGAMRVDMTMVAAILGAIAGDGLSYSIGRIFRFRLTNLWPFSRYPTWLKYGNAYFVKHGSKSVLIGRFTGPLRAIIPIIAGMMGMNRFHFFLANVISAIGWSFLYIIPGVLIGTASNELSPNVASKLFVVLLTLLAGILLLSYVLKWLFIRIRQWLHHNLDSAWTMLLQQRFGRFFNIITPQFETTHHRTAAFFFLLCGCFLIMSGVLCIEGYTHWFDGFDQPVYQFFKSIRTNDFDTFFIVERLNISFLPMLAMTAIAFIIALYHRHWRLLGYMTSLCVVTLSLAFLLSQGLSKPVQSPCENQIFMLSSPFQQMMFATSIYSFFVFYISRYYPLLIGVIIKVFLLITLFLSGVALVYLGEDWITNIILAITSGFSISLLHWLFYRNAEREPTDVLYFILFPVLFSVLTTTLSSKFFFIHLSEKYQPYVKQYVIHPDTWWNQNQSILPLYTKNRFGKKMGLLNLQYLGSMNELKEQFEKKGWKRQYDSFISSLLTRLNRQHHMVTLPLTAQLYMNKKPILLMTYSDTLFGDIVLRLWRSNFHIYNHNQVLWIGSIYQSNQFPSQKHFTIEQLLSKLDGYETKKIIIDEKTLPIPYSAPPVLWLIRKKPSALA